MDELIFNDTVAEWVAALLLTAIGGGLLASGVAGIVMTKQHWAGQPSRNTFLRLLQLPFTLVFFTAWWLVGIASALALTSVNAVALVVAVAWLGSKGLPSSAVSTTLIVALGAGVFGVMSLTRNWKADRRSTPSNIPNPWTSYQGSSAIANIPKD